MKPFILFLLGVSMPLLGCMADNPDYSGYPDGGNIADLRSHGGDLAPRHSLDFAVCVPQGCVIQGKSCGAADDGCGHPLDCGDCTAPSTCGGGGTPNQCGGAMTADPPTCTLTVTPAKGTLVQRFTFTAMSMNASQCTATVDNGKPFANPCNQTSAHFGWEFGSGKHSATLYASGVGGMAQCSCDWVVQ